MKKHNKKNHEKLAKALKQNIIRRKEKKMGIMPDFWIQKMAKNFKMIDPFVEKLVKKMYCLMDYLHTDMMLEYLDILKFLQM